MSKEKIKIELLCSLKVEGEGEKLITYNNNNNKIPTNNTIKLK